MSDNDKFGSPRDDMGFGFGGSNGQANGSSPKPSFGGGNPQRPPQNGQNGQGVTIVVVIIMIVIGVCVAIAKIAMKKEISSGAMSLFLDSSEEEDYSIENYRNAPKDHSEDAFYFLHCRDVSQMNILKGMGADIEAVTQPKHYRAVALVVSNAQVKLSDTVLATFPGLRDRVQLLKNLHEAGANIDAVFPPADDVSNITPLMLSVTLACTDPLELPIVQTLIDLHARQDLRDSDGWSALDYAKRHNNCVHSPQRDRLLAMLSGDSSDAQAGDDDAPTRAQKGDALADGGSKPKPPRLAVSPEQAQIAESYMEAVTTACKRNDLGPLRQLIQSGADASLVDADGDGAFHAVSLCKKNSPTDTIISMLKEAGADIDLVDLEGFSPLMLAAIKMCTDDGDGSAVRALVKAGANLEARDNDGDTVLARTLLVCDEQTSEYEPTISLLLELGADFNVRSSENAPLSFYSLQYICRRNKLGFLPTVEKYIHPNVFDDDLDSALTFAALGCSQNEKVQLAVVKSLLKLGADVNHQNKKRKSSLMYAVDNACESGSLSVVKALLDAKPNVNLVDSDGDTAYTNAIYTCGHNSQIDPRPLIRLLTNAGADVNHVNGHHYPPIVIAASFCSENNLSILKAVIESGTNVSATTQKGLSAEDLVKGMQEENDGKCTDEAAEAFLKELQNAQKATNRRKGGRNLI